MITVSSYKIETQREWKQTILRDLRQLLETIPDNDEPASVQKLIRYLQALLRIKQVVPPMVEIMTLIKERKPALYHGTRRNVLQSSNLHMLFQVEMDPQLASQRLEEYVNS
ncbi:hypothetical protein [Brevibacillus sp. H7]|uniref:hypothetical protein n=1 Tax=Brevibacillus sp. H7 TaxID=3349138 RepID=UPI00380AECD5